jgi:hypothetical protein
MIELADLEIHKVTRCASLSTGTSSTTESIGSLNPEINLGNASTREVEDLNLCGQVPPHIYDQFTYSQGLFLWSFRHFVSQLLALKVI